MSTYYLHDAIHPNMRPGSVNLAMNFLCPRVDKFDSIVCTGVSGMLLAPIVAHLLNKNIVVVRNEKSHVRTHAITQVESGTGIYGIGRYVFVDDLIETGATLVRVADTIQAEVDQCIADGDTSTKYANCELSPLNYPKMVGLYLYCGGPVIYRDILSGLIADELLEMVGALDFTNARVRSFVGTTRADFQK